MNSPEVMWHTSSKSSAAGQDCIEIATAWRKSSRSLGDNEQCVEVASAVEAVLIRDSKDAAGPHHVIAPAAFRDLVGQIKSGELDL